MNIDPSKLESDQAYATKNNEYPAYKWSEEEYLEIPGWHHKYDDSLMDCDCDSEIICVNRENDMEHGCKCPCHYE